jgi:uncharacterized protein
MDWEKINGFEWDNGNIRKNWESHRVMHLECEQVFFNKPLLVFNDENHSSPLESRFYALGQTDHQRKLYSVFTVRGNLIRVISCRDMSRKERNIYEKNKETDASF